MQNPQSECDGGGELCGTSAGDPAGAPVRCPHCGYDLTGLPVAHRCPECGAEFHRAELPLTLDAAFGARRTAYVTAATLGAWSSGLALLAILQRGVLAPACAVMVIFVALAAASLRWLVQGGVDGGTLLRFHAVSTVCALPLILLALLVAYLAAWIALAGALVAAIVLLRAPSTPEYLIDALDARRARALRRGQWTTWALLVFGAGLGALALR